MNIVLYGASGMIGSAILAEAVARGHRVTAVARRPDAIAATDGVRAVAGDVTDAASIARSAVGADVAVSAFGPGGGDQDDLAKSAVALLDGLAQAGVGRTIVVGGAGSLLVPGGGRLVDQPGFPALYRARALAQSRQLDVLRASAGTPVAWTFVSPAAEIAPGERTGRFRIGGDALLVDASGASRISVADFAFAVVDEAERATAPNRRISIAY